MTTPIDSFLGPVPADKTSLTDDERIENIVPLPPPEHLIRFFPIQGTPVETLISRDAPQGARHPARQVRPAAGGDRARARSTIRPPRSNTPGGSPPSGGCTRASSRS